MPSAHARRNASGTKRWMACTASIAASEGRPSSSSAAAREGTAAHALGEACLLDGSDAASWVGGYVRLDQREQATVHPPVGEDVVVPVHATGEGLPPAGHEDFPIDADMADAVQVYLTAVRDEMEALGPDAELVVEERFDLNVLVGYDFDEEAYAADPGGYLSPSGMYVDDDGVLRRPDGVPSLGPMFGTNDASVSLWMDHVTVFDYKHGRGIAVEVCHAHVVDGVEVVEGNTQEMYYALGKAYRMEWAFETLDLVIVQPRKAHADGPVRRYRTSKEELRRFEAVLREKALETEDEAARVFVAGDHCTFCPAAGAPCRALMEHAFQEATVEFDDATGEVSSVPLSEWDDDERLARAAAAVPVLDAFVKSVKAEQLRRLMATEDGVASFGKLVRKRSVRRFVPGVDHAAELVKLGFPREALFEEPKAKGPAKVEKLRPPELIARLKAEGVRAPAKHLEAMVAGLTEKPPGGVTVAPLSDPRDPVPPADAAESDFDEIPEEE